MKTISSLAIIESASYFASLSPEAMEYLLESVREQSFARGESIMREGEPCPGLFVVESGLVKLYRSPAEGKEQIVRIVGRGGCFDCTPLLDRGPNPLNAQALEATRLCFLPASDFWSLIRTHPQATLTFASILAMRLRSLLNMVEVFSFKRVFSRLARLLLQLAERDDKASAVSSTLPLSQQHLAYMLGCSRQAVNSSLRKLARAGVIKMEGRRIIVLKPGVLARIS